MEKRGDLLEVETGRRQGVEPQEYLRDVLERIPGMTNQQIPELVPVGMEKAEAKETSRLHFLILIFKRTSQSTP